MKARHLFQRVLAILLLLTLLPVFPFAAKAEEAAPEIDVALKGYQTANGGASLRIWSSINNLENYASVGLSVAIKETEKTKEGQTETVFRALTGTDKEGKAFEITAESLGAEALYATVLQNIAEGSYTLTLTPFATTKEGARVTGTAKTFVYTNGERTGLFALPDFLVQVDEGKDVRILHLSDTQIVDSTQQRSEDRLGSTLYNYWLPEKMDDRCFDYVRETVAAVKPDLIVITGDLVYGEFDDKGTSFKALIDLMESFQIPWAPVFGNHDNESRMGADWQCEQLENAEYCLFEQKTLTGNGNYSVGIVQGGELLRVFYMLDSNGCGGASSASTANGHTKTSVGFGQDQIDWYTNQINAIHAISPSTKITFAYHIQQAVFQDAYAKYGFNNSDTASKPINIDRLENKAEGDFGYLGANLKSAWDGDRTVYLGMKALGADSILVGHEHSNSASVVYDGVRFQYGQKSSTYDRANYVNMQTGAITTSYSEAGTPLIGGTAMVLGEDGAIKDAYIYLCENAGGSIDWSQWISVEVGGLQIGTDLTLEHSGLSVTTDVHEGKNAFVVSASRQGKIYFDVETLPANGTLTFSVFIPEGSAQLSGMGELSIRMKNASQGYYKFSSTAASDEVALELGTWQTFTVDLGAYSTAYSEFAFIIPAGNTYYFADITVEEALPYLQFGSGLSLQSGLSTETVTHEGKTAYAVTAPSQGKLYIAPALAEGKSTFTFSVFVPEGNTKLQGYGETAIRCKSTFNGYIDFNSSKATNTIVPGTWQTFTVDISSYSEYTEFAFVIPKGNTVYFCDMYFS